MKEGLDVNITDFGKAVTSFYLYITTTLNAYHLPYNLTPFKNNYKPIIIVIITEFSMAMELEMLYVFKCDVENRTSCNILDDLAILHYIWCMGKGM